MAQKIAPLLPTTAERLLQFGDRLRMARLRRHLSAKQVAERAGMAPMTLRSLERGGSGVTMGAYLAVMQVLGMEQDLDLLGAADPLGRDLQDARLLSRPQPRQQSAQPPNGVVQPARRRAAVDPSATSATAVKRKTKALEQAPDWMAKGGFASSQALAGLLTPTTVTPKSRR